jgi:hypothetical protein
MDLHQDVKQMATVELEQQKEHLEEQYNQQKEKNADVLTLSNIWKRIKEVEAELKLRKG